jgi:membrane protein DedA with SNARE-associated domain
VTSFVGNHGLFAVALLMFVAAVLPAASEVTMLYGGALSSGALAGQISLGGHHFKPGFDSYLAVVLTGVGANLVGVVFGWALGAYGGHDLLERHGRWLHVTPERIERAERWFERFGSRAVPLGFACPVIRSFVALPAGIAGWPLRRLLPFALAGILTFCFAIAGLGWAVGSSWHSARHYLSYLDYLVVAAAILGAGFWVYRRRTDTMSRRGDSAR